MPAGAAPRVRSQTAAERRKEQHGQTDLAELRSPAGLPITWALADPKLDERQVLMCILDEDAELLAERPGLLLIADKGYISAELDYLHARGAELLRPAYRNRAPRPGQQLLAPIRQLIESVHDTLEGQLDLELHDGRSLAGAPPGSPSACSPSPPSSGTTAPPASRSPDP
jgi:hypothetical protein